MDVARKPGSSSHWRKQESRDIFVDRAARQNLRSRAYFKLEQIQTKEKILKRGYRCVDLGATPGGWSQFAIERVGSNGKVWALDLSPMQPLAGVTFILGDFTSDPIRESLLASMGEERVDLVMSDMAPNITGNRAVDQPRMISLAEDAMVFSEEALRQGGSFLVKLFQGEGFEDYVALVRTRFGRVKLIKPQASRSDSREMYLLAGNYGM
ncbi:MAG: RlmE family RNA methyltransferase [Gammaproteobacteria bacterium]